MNFSEKIVFENYYNREEHYLITAYELENHEPYRSQIVLICNQLLVYKNLFQDSFSGEPYKDSNANEFLNWAHQGWKDKTHFVFFIINADNRIVGALDIKSSNLDDAEIGYWADSNYRGNITNALKELVTSASQNGFNKLTAFVHEDNSRSSRVLKRVGFENINESKKKGYLQFERKV